MFGDILALTLLNGSIWGVHGPLLLSVGHDDSTVEVQTLNIHWMRKGMQKWAQAWPSV